jgi:hypothetical protein
MLKILSFLFLAFTLAPHGVRSQINPDWEAKQSFFHLGEPTLFEGQSEKYPAPEDTAGSRTIGGAFMRSLVLPGWGQRYAGAKTAARNFFVVEAFLWGSFAAFQIYGHWLEDDYKLFAATHASAEVNGKEDQFFVDIGNFINIDEFNQSRLRRRDVEGLYDPATHFWRWDTDANRQKFENLRIRSDKAFSNATFVIAGVIANHLISGIHAAWTVHKKADKQEKVDSKGAHLGVRVSPKQVKLVAQVKF